jgi:hypothetical protein
MFEKYYDCLAMNSEEYEDFEGHKNLKNSRIFKEF